MSATAKHRTTPIDLAPLRDTIRILGRTLDDIERVRIMLGNRIGALEREQGGSLPHLQEILRAGEQWEHISELELVRAFRKDPLAPWGKSVRGLGEPSFARLIAELGDPSIASRGHWETQQTNGSGAIVATESISRAPRSRVWIVDDYFDRTVSQLWQYCGVGDPKRSKIPKGAVQADLLGRGKPRLKTQLYLIATSMLKAGIRHGEGCGCAPNARAYLCPTARSISESGARYLDARAHYAERVHDEPCPQCHAKAGDPWKPGHQHAAALRKVEKEFLKALWHEARRVRGITS